MKKLLKILLVTLLAIMVFVVPVTLIVKIASASEITKTFAWDAPPADELARIKNWEMHWGNTAGGPYAKLVDIPKNGNFEQPVTVDISGPPATNQTRYFVLRACGDLAQEDGSTKYECSENSNEVSLTVWIPANKFQVPVNFRMIPE